MPVNRKYDMGKLREALQGYLIKTNRKLFIEYIMLSGINDSVGDAKNLATYLKSIGKLQLIHVNLIRYNSTSQSLASSSREITLKFKESLLRSGIEVTIRKSLGEDIQGACGQLVQR